jgi:hypothetical protein
MSSYSLCLASRALDALSVVVGEAQDSLMMQEKKDEKNSKRQVN